MSRRCALLIVMRAVVLTCAVQLWARWPDGGTSPGWTLPAGTPVWLDPDQLDAGVVRVRALDEVRAYADVPAGSVAPLGCPGDSTVAPPF